MIIRILFKIVDWKELKRIFIQEQYTRIKILREAIRVKDLIFSY